MGIKKKLVAPEGLSVDFAPSPKQYEVWKALQPECPDCGGEIIMKENGLDDHDNMTYIPVCKKCGLDNIPKMVLAGGSAGGGKSYLGSWWLISSCLRFPGIRAGVGRKTLKTLKASTLKTIINILKKELHLIEDVHYFLDGVNGELTFWNGSEIVLLELKTLPSDEQFSRFGSSEFTCIFVDECNEMDMKAIDVLFSRIRWKTHETFKVSKMLLSTNPDVNWVRDRFVQDDAGDPVKCAKYERYIPFSLFDNPNPEFRATYEASLRMMTEPEKQRLLYGNWDFVKANDMAFYRCFDGAKHLEVGLRERVYDPEAPLIVGFDFNVFPQMSCLLAQVDYEEKNIYITEEIAGTPKNKANNTPAMSKLVRKKLKAKHHNSTFVITGDPAGIARSSQTAEGVNNYTIIKSELKDLHTKQSLMRIAPSQSLRGEWINEIFANNYEGWSIVIDMRCRKLTEDLIYQLAMEDGSKDKSKVRDADTGVRYEKYGHYSDVLDYILCLFLKKAWYKYKRGGNEHMAPASAPVLPTWSY